MAFFVSKLLWIIANPANMLGLLVAFTAGAAVLGWRRVAAVLLTLLVLLCGTLTLTPLPNTLLATLENRFPQPDLAKLARVDGVIVLGGAVDTNRSAAFNTLVVSDAGERLLALVDLGRRYPNAKLVMSGGSADLDGGDTVREADLVRDRFLPMMGFDPTRVIFERDSRNTDENARYSARLVNPQPGETWLLVTSAYHMPRAMGIFRKQGWSVVPYPVDYGSWPESKIAFDLLAGLHDFYWASREWIGLVYYRALGRTESLFPAP
ncbi:MAG: YdcF family protein [Elstera sp.]